MLRDLYPSTAEGSVIGGDGAGMFQSGAERNITLTLTILHILGTVIASYNPNDPLIRKRVFFVPTRGWDADPVSPEKR